MAQLRVFLNGQFVSQHDLDVSRELLAGRGETCDIVLNPERGISRQHFRCRFAEGQWVVEVLSRYGELYRNGEKQSIFPLRDGTTFTVPPYEFVFENDAEGLAPQPSDLTGNADIGGGGGEEDKTHIGYLPSVAYLRLIDNRGQALQNYRLEGQAWIGGRDTSCSIFIDNSRISRKQFEIQKQDEAYFIRDLGSVNGTLLNGRPLSTEDWTQLASSDVITVADWTLQFELRDAQFEQRLSEVDPALMIPVQYQEQAYADPDAAFSPLEMGGAGPAPAPGGDLAGGFAASPPPTPQKPGMVLFGRQIPGLNPIRLGIGVVVLLAALYAVFGETGATPEQPAKVLSAFDKLPPEKQQMVKQFYLAAQSLLAQGRYELAKQEILKLHQIISPYEDSLKIEETANRGIAMLQEREKIEAEERQRAINEEKIQHQVAECRKELNPDSTGTWADTCLSPVMEFNPEHPAIVALKNEVQRLEAEKAMKVAQEKEYAEQVGRLKALFAKAQRVEKEQGPLPGIAAYEQVVRSKLPDPHGLHKAASRQIASLQEGIVAIQAEAEKKAEVSYRAGQLRQAILTLREGMKANPDNEVLKGKHQQYMTELRKQMMGFYQEGILEESMGEVDTAKSKWRKILDQSLPGEDYYEKAKIKLKKYGAI
jgi:pSer/pThr/pTyr-binding forkhead associated (FHA) protein